MLFIHTTQRLPRCVGRMGLALLLGMGLTLGTQSALAQTSSQGRAELHPNPDAQLLAIYKKIAAGENKEALSQVDRLIQQYPNFRLAHLIRGDLLASRIRPLKNVGDAPNAPADSLNDLREEARMRLVSLREKPPANGIPSVLMQLSPEQKTALVVDSSRARIYVYENVNGRPKFLTDFYMSVGKYGIDKVRQGDQKTPLGVYSITGSIAKEKLADLYGVGALPMNYPNEWDIRQGRTGYGIWLHGVPKNTYSRAPKASDGCVVLTNTDMQTLFNYVQVGNTPVVIAAKVQWLNAEQWNSQRQSFLQTFEAWRKDWESRDFAHYTEHYSNHFYAEGSNLKTWLSKRKSVVADREWIKLSTNNVAFYRYPAQHEMIYVTFEQDYQANNLRAKLRKRQYWVNEGGHWRIVYENTTEPTRS